MGSCLDQATLSTASNSGMLLIGVSIAPGAIALTRIPYWPSSIAAVRVKFALAALLAA
jgi:hypothetical protein